MYHKLYMQERPEVGRSTHILIPCMCGSSNRVKSFGRTCEHRAYRLRERCLCYIIELRGLSL